MVGGGKDREEMRLIDADALLAKVRQIDFLKAPNSTKISACEIMAIINKQPTVFDTEKVVEQLMIIHDEGYCPNENDFECVLDKTCSDCYREKIIDIVKKGGVE